MIRITSIAQAEKLITRAIARTQPVTLTYTRADGVETLRTVEPYGAVLESKAGDLYVKAMDRESGETRSWRLDRISFLTVHRTYFLIKNPTNEKEVFMAIDNELKWTVEMTRVGVELETVSDDFGILGTPGTWHRVRQGERVSQPMRNRGDALRKFQRFTQAVELAIDAEKNEAPAGALRQILRYAEGAPKPSFGDTRERSGAILERVTRVKDTGRLEAELRAADALYPSASRQEKTDLYDVTHALRKVIAARRTA